jgi:hypothetical protein
VCKIGCASAKNSVKIFVNGRFSEIAILEQASPFFAVTLFLVDCEVSGSISPIDYFLLSMT